MDSGVLNNLLGFLVIGALFYLVMRKVRGGCCGHSHDDNQHGSHSHGGSKTDKMKDPVCGMEVDTSDTNMSRNHNGQSFYFCSSQCMEKFDKEPMAYMGSAQKRGGCC